MLLGSWGLIEVSEKAKRAKYNKCATTFLIVVGCRGGFVEGVQHFQKVKIKNLWYWESIAMVYK